MRSRATLALLALLAVLGAAAALVVGPWRSERPREHGAALPGLVPAEVQTVRITRDGADVLLAREGGGWRLGEAREAADAAAVEALVADLAAVEVGAVVSKNAAKQAAYETDAEKGIAVPLEGAGGKLVAAFTVGKRGPDFASAYLKRDGAAEVLLVSRDVRTPLASRMNSARYSVLPTVNSEARIRRSASAARPSPVNHPTRVSSRIRSCGYPPRSIGVVPEISRDASITPGGARETTARLTSTASSTSL